MRRHTLLVVVAAAGLLVAADGTQVAARDAKGLQVIFTDKKMTLSKGDKERYDATYVLHPDAKPKAIDIKFLMGPDEGKTFHGVYEVQGDNLKLCWSEAGQKRPEGFVTKAKSGRTLYVLKRGKPR